MEGLPHNSFLTAQSIQQCVDAVQLDRSLEVDLAASKHFWDYEGDLDATWVAYRNYYLSTKTELQSLLGDPEYSGNWDSPERREWVFVLPEYADAEELTVWKKGDIKLYLRLSWEDKEIPMLVALGSEGCQMTGVAYPGQF